MITDVKTLNSVAFAFCASISMSNDKIMSGNSMSLSRILTIISKNAAYGTMLIAESIVEYCFTVDGLCNALTIEHLNVTHLRG